MTSCLTELAKLFLREEASLFLNVGNAIEDINSRLKTLLYLVPEAERASSTSVEVEKWLHNVRQVAFEVEDVRKVYSHYMERGKRAREEINCEMGFQEFFRKLGSFLLAFCGAQRQKHDSAWLIKNIMGRLDVLNRDAKSYGLERRHPLTTITTTTNDDGIASTSTSTTVTITKSSSNTKERPFYDVEIVGIESAIKGLVDMLVDDLSNLKVIGVVGEGGSGKTTLARQVYDRIRKEFECCVWVEEPETPYNSAKVLKKLAKEISKPVEEISKPSSFETINFESFDTMQEFEMAEELKNFLRGKAYFFVFDNVWKEEFWSNVELALKDKESKGRVLITTRNMKVVERCKRSVDRVHTHNMKLMGDREAWDLFCKRVFSPDGNCPSELEGYGRKILERCGGLPLAILAMAGVLRSKDKRDTEWKEFYNQMPYELKNDTELTKMMKILSLSYNDLPSTELKFCFLYFGMFPKSSEVRNGRLIRAWIAQGFVKEEPGGISLESLAQCCMDELISRSLVQVPSLYKTRTRTESRKCRVHDLYHEMILKEGSNIGFSHVYGIGQLGLSPEVISRHLSFIDTSKEELEKTEAPHAHSAIFFSPSREMIDNAVPKLYKNFYLLKVLDFEGCWNLDNLPESIGDLFDLRYLSLRETNVKKLPESIEKLHNLETLDLKYSLVFKVPAGAIGKLYKLRYLYGGDFPQCKGVKLNGEIRRLKSMIKLCFVDVDDRVLAELGNLTRLTTLGITKLRTEDGAALCACLAKMRELRSLFVASTDPNNGYIDLEFKPSLPPPEDLKHITLYGPLRKLPGWIAGLKHLVKLRLFSSRLGDDDMQVIKKMHSLLDLQLPVNNAYVGQHLRFEAGSLENLRQLTVMNSTTLRAITVEERAMPKLESLTIGSLPELKDFPIGLRHLTSLKQLHFHDMPRVFKFLAFDYKVHTYVPSITFAFQQVNSDKSITMVFEDLASDSNLTLIGDRPGRIAIKKDKDSSGASSSTNQNQ